MDKILNEIANLISIEEKELLLGFRVMVHLERQHLLIIS